MKSEPINTGEPLIDNLYNAVRDYVEAGNGKVIVIGGVQIQDHKNGTFYLAVKCTGVVPDFAKVEDE